MLFKLGKKKRFIARILITLLCLSNVFNFSSMAAQSGLLGSNAALGSPLLSDNFTTDDWNSWEMLCFGIFLSNFCQPFQDDYASAFTDGASQGSQGRGLKALQFASGGDVNSSGYLADMVSYCKEAQSQSYKPLYVNYSYWEYDENISNTITGSTRIAYFDDLVPLLYTFTQEKTDSVQLFTNANIVQPLVSYGTLHYAETDDGVGVNVVSDLQKTYVEYAILPTFYTTANMDSNTVIFDMTENWDIQILKSLFAKEFNKDASSDYTTTETAEDTGIIDNALKDKLDKYLGRKYPLVMDTFGNICIQNNSRQVVIIPASANQHITKQESYNYLNSLILNNYVLSDIDAKVITNAEEQDVSGSHYNYVGNYPMKHTDEISDGRLLITADTDTSLMPYIYSQLRANSETQDVHFEIDDTTGAGTSNFKYSHPNYSAGLIDLASYKLGASLYNLLDTNSLHNQPVQIHITGANSKVDTETGKFIFWTDRNMDETTVDTALGAYGLLSTLFTSTAEEKDILDYFYVYDSDTTLEDTKMSLFSSDSFYLSPSLKGDKHNTMQLYLNYYYKVMSDEGESLDATLSASFINNRDTYASYLSQQTGFLNTWYTLCTSENVRVRIDTDPVGLYGLKANEIYKGFLKTYYKEADSTRDMNTILQDSSTIISMLEMYYSLSDVKVPGYNLDYTFPSGRDTGGLDYPNNGGDGTLSRVVKVYKPSSGFQAISSVFGLSDGCQFELYSPYIYITYLDFYGLLGSSNSNNFKEAIFDGAFFKTFTADNFTNGLTKEQMEEQTKLNVYKLLALNSDGAKYRKQLATSIIRSTWVEKLDDQLNKGGVGNVGAETNFLDVSTLEENFLLGDIIKNHWSTISLILFGVLSILAIVSGALNNRTVSWYFVILVASSSMVYSIPLYLNITPVIIEKYINSNYKNTGAYWALAESVEYDKNISDLANSDEDSTKLIAILNTLNYLDTDSSLMVKLDISQKVISNTAINYNTLQRLKSARWILPSLMKQMSATDNTYDYVSVPVTRLYDNYAKIWIMYNGASDYMPSTPSGSEASSKADQVSIKDVINKQSLWSGENGYKSTAPEYVGAGNSTKSVSRVRQSNIESTHTGFYLLDGLSIESAYDAMGKSYLTRDDWESYASKVVSGDIKNDDFAVKADDMLAELNSYNQYQNPIRQSFGYLWTTENLGTYFYTLVKDTFDEGGESRAQSVASVALQLQGSYATTEDGDEVRTSFMHYKETGYERDVCDMEEVFTNVMPYMYQMMVMANGTSDHNGLLGSKKMVGNSYYSDNYLSWIFRTNWVTKIYEDSLYSGSAKVVARDEDGNITGEYKVENMSDPRAYPEERPMVFSEAQMYAQHLTTEDLTFTEVKILDFNTDVIRRWTSLLNYVNTDGLEKEHLYREMAIEALFAFNETFTRDNIVMTEKTLYPLNFDLRQISMITILRSLFCNLTNSNTYMTGDLAGQLFDNYSTSGYLAVWIVYHAFIIFAGMRELWMAIAFVSAVATLICNFATTSKNKFKAMFGWVITSGLFCAITIFYYFIVSLAVGNPTVDTMINFNTLTSTRLSKIPLWLCALLIATLTFLYCAVIVVYFYELWIGHKFGLSVSDGGFGFYYQLADKATKAMIGATEKVGKKFNKTFGNLKNWGPGAVDDGVEKKKDIKARKIEYNESQKKKKNQGSDDSSELSGTDFSSNYNNGSVTSGEDKNVTDNINKHIQKSKKSEAAAENQKKADITTNNIDNDTTVNIINETNQQLDDSSKISEELNNRIEEDKKIQENINQTITDSLNQ